MEHIWCWSAIVYCAVREANAQPNRFFFFFFFFFFWFLSIKDLQMDLLLLRWSECSVMLLESSLCWFVISQSPRTKIRNNSTSFHVSMSDIGFHRSAGVVTRRLLFGRAFQRSAAKIITVAAWTAWSANCTLDTFDCKSGAAAWWDTATTEATDWGHLSIG